MVSCVVEKIKTTRTRHDFRLSRSRDAPPGFPPLPLVPPSHIRPLSEKEVGPHPSGEGRGT
jgi:hypothetical protein